MKYAIIGHRGTGKTSFLERAKFYYERAGRAASFFDLDQEIAKAEGISVAEIFSTKGESAFRQLEQSHFDRLDRELSKRTEDCFVSLGGGFEGPKKSGWEYLWVKRPTDTKGRVFLNRPRLTAGLGPLEEYLQRVDTRTKRYMQMADQILETQEGFDFINDEEREWLLGDIQQVGGAVTVPGSRYNDRIWLQRQIQRGVKWLELRDDLLSFENLQLTLKILCEEWGFGRQILFSLRNQSETDRSLGLIRKYKLNFDWPLERGLPTKDLAPTVLSLHTKSGSLTETLENLNAVSPGLPKSTIKLALMIDDFRELEEVHNWVRQDPANRSFLPMSTDGRWKWYRLWMSTRSPLQFWREGDGSAIDQPTLIEWTRRKKMANAMCFAAILGDPVAHSRTPAEQFEFFKKLGAPVFSIRMTEQEWKNGALEFLGSLGLKWAAVTSPLKTICFDSSIVYDSITQELGASNTLVWSQQKKSWLSTNTDLFGLSYSAEEEQLLSLEQVVIWGGGGTLEVIRRVFPAASSYSAQSGLPRNNELPCEFPRLLIWGVGRAQFEKSNIWPDPSWKPDVIFDLNYAEDSPGLEYAQKTGSRYVSGIKMFKAQALGQREFWQKMEREGRL